LHRRSFEAGSTILSKGTLADGLYLIASGLAGLNISDDGDAGRDIASLGRGECVGEMSLVNGEPCSATIHALVDTETWFISRADFPDVVERCPTLWRNLSGILSHRLVKTNRRLADARQARFSTVYLALDNETASALSLLLGLSLARQTRRRVLLADLRDGQASLLPGHPELGREPLEVEACREGGSLTVTAFGAGHAVWDEAAFIEDLRERFDEVVLLRAPEDAPAERPFPAHAAASLLITTESRLDQAAQALTSLRDLRQRLDVAVLTDLTVTSDNKVGGLWERGVVGRRNKIAARLALSEADAGLRLLPRDMGALAQVAAKGPGAIDHESDEPFIQAARRLARRLGRVEVGVALGAGMAKGFAHLGVLSALSSHRVPVDYIAGSSIGSIVGSTYAGGMLVDQLQELMTGADRRFVKPTLPHRSLSSNRGLKKVLTSCHERAPTAEFPELFVPFAAVATDLKAGQEVVLREGVVWNTVLASVSMPGLFPPVVYEGRVLVDGGLTNPVPGTTVRDMGADIVIGVDLAGVRRKGPGARKLEPSPRLPNIIETVWRTMEIMLGEISSRSAATADIVIRPNTGHTQVRDFSRRGPEFLAAGERAALAALPEVATYLPSIEVEAQ
jgi:NTE family protein